MCQTKLLEKDNWAILHNRNIQLLAPELLKGMKGLPPLFMNEISVEHSQITI